MSKYEEIYSESGIKNLIDLTNKEIEEKKKEYREVCEGKRYNPLCADGWKKEIQNQISDYEKTLIDLEQALKIKLGLFVPRED